MKSVPLSLLLFIFLVGCGSKSLKPDDFPSEFRVIASLANESEEFCKLVQQGAIRRHFPNKHLQDLGKELEDSKKSLENEETTPETKDVKQRLLSAYDDLEQQLAAMDGRLKKDSADAQACDRERLHAISAKFKQPEPQQ